MVSNKMVSNEKLKWIIEDAIIDAYCHENIRCNTCPYSARCFDKISNDIIDALKELQERREKESKNDIV